MLKPCTFIHHNYRMTMRKLMSFFMISTLLLISCMPNISLAAACDMPMNDMAMSEMTTQNMTLSNDAQDCSIQCVCMCIQDVDGLPHLLSPHLVSQMANLPIFEALETAELYRYAVYFYMPSVQLPPPNLS